MFHYGDVGFIADPSEKMVYHLSRWWHLHAQRDSDLRGFSAPGIDHLPRPSYPLRNPPRLNVLHWPNGASRWASFHGLMSGSNVATLRDKLNEAGTDWNETSLTLTLSDTDASESPSISVSMFCLPPVPIYTSPDGKDELYLVSLVDARHYWWMTGDFEIATLPDSWTALFETLLDAVGVDSSNRTIDSIDSGYDVPTARWLNMGPRPLPMLLDAAARFVGMRVVRTTGGRVVIRKWSEADTIAGAFYTRLATDLVSGGKLTVPDIARSVPSSVEVVFFDPTGGNEVETDNVTLSDLCTAGSLPDYQEEVVEAEPTKRLGMDGPVGVVWVDMSRAASAGTKTTCANSAAADYYRWALSRYDAEYRGIRWYPLESEQSYFSPTGIEDAVEWDHSERRIVTRVLRPPMHDANVYADNIDITPAGSGSGSEESSGSSGGVCVDVVTGVCIERASGSGGTGGSGTDPIVRVTTEFRTICFPEGTTVSEPFCAEADEGGCCDDPITICGCDYPRTLYAQFLSSNASAGSCISHLSIEQFTISYVSEMTTSVGVRYGWTAVVSGYGTCTEDITLMVWPPQDGDSEPSECGFFYYEAYYGETCRWPNAPGRLTTGDYCPLFVESGTVNGNSSDPTFCGPMPANPAYGITTRVSETSFL